METKLSNLFPGPKCPTSRTLSAAAGAETYSCEFGSGTYYAYCGLGGLLSCGITHTMVTPLDLVKCRLQVTFRVFDMHF
jgi:solute carrier family 25 phosphate transporter 3